MPPLRTIRESIFSAAPGLEAAEFLFDRIADVLYCVKDCEGRYVAANEAFIKRAGVTHRNQLIGRTAGEIFPVILAAGYEQQDVEVFATGKPVRDRIEMITQADGSLGWFVSDKVPVKSTEGEMIALASTSRDLQKSAAAHKELGSMAKTLETLRKDYAKPLRIEQLANETGMTWSQFERKVRSITGLSPRNLLTKNRVEAAAQLLLSTDRPLAKVASECGFYDQAAFSRQFRAVTGLSPSEYRNAFHK